MCIRDSGVRGVFTAGAVVGGLLLTRDLVITLAVLLALNLGYVCLLYTSSPMGVSRGGSLYTCSSRSAMRR